MIVIIIDGKIEYCNAISPDWMSKKVNPEIKTVGISYRVAPAVARDIDKLVAKGLYKDRSEFSSEAVREKLAALKSSEEFPDLEIPLGRIEESSRRKARPPY